MSGNDCVDCFEPSAVPCGSGEKTPVRISKVGSSHAGHPFHGFKLLQGENDPSTYFVEATVAVPVQDSRHFANDDVFSRHITAQFARIKLSFPDENIRRSSLSSDHLDYPC